MPVSGISVLGRVTSGVILINMENDVKVASLAKVREEKIDDSDESEDEEEHNKENVELEDKQINAESEDKQISVDSEKAQIQELLNRAKEDEEE